MIERIVNGGQTGVDQAALSVACDLNIAYGGWCPADSLDEDGLNVRIQYPLLKAAMTSHPNERTKLNIRDSDGTLLIVPQWPLAKIIVDGTLLTYQETLRANKPCLIIALNDCLQATCSIRSWLSNNHIKILNIAGPRESSWPGVYVQTQVLLLDVFRDLHLL